ncbi:hypothetical protein FYJ43_01505 [Cutibacterium sp. WCA-380-WT-3A]|uniref:Uncharacterized protein n=1 Tax=Cutibacterium porci TaxID=2605781 RepID=A0A7K0J495_9ACTN|nr:hypothetical protein [Cutibacterium porci]MSS44756.1 hypothetical protein [Cutibacterium porci]
MASSCRHIEHVCHGGGAGPGLSEVATARQAAAIEIAPTIIAAQHVTTSGSPAVAIVRENAARTS